MILTEIILKIKLNKKSELYWNYLQENNVKAAMDLYETYLVKYEDKLNPNIIGAYYFNHWLMTKSEQDIKKLISLSYQHKNAIQIQRIINIYKSMSRQEIVSKYLSGKQIQTDSTRKLNFNGNNIIELLASLILVFHQKNDKNEKEIAAIIRNKLPQRNQLNKNLLKLHDYLFIWSNLRIEDYSILVDNIDSLENCNSYYNNQFKVNLFVKYALKNISKFSVDKIVSVSKIFNNNIEKESFLNIVLYIGVKLLQTNHNKTQDWFHFFINHNKISQYNIYLRFGELISLYKSTQFHEGLELSYQLIKEYEKNEYSDLNVNNDYIKELVSYLQWMETLVLLAQSEFWPSPSSDENDKNILYENQNKLTVILSSVKSKKAHFLVNKYLHKWRIDLIWGLIAYVNQNSVLTKNEYIEFQEAYEHFSDLKIRQKFNKIADNILARIEAIERIYTLVENRQYEELKEFYKNVLLPIESSIPKTLLATVYMSLFDYEPGFNSIPLLEKLNDIDIDNTHIDRSINISKSIKNIIKFSEVLTNNNNIPSEILKLNLYTDFSDTIILKLALALVNMKNKKVLEVQRILPDSLVNQHNEYKNQISAIIFYTNWITNNIDECIKYMDILNNRSNYIQVKGNYYNTIQLELLLKSLEENDKKGIHEILYEIFSIGPETRSINKIFNYINWLIKKKQYLKIEKLVLALIDFKSNQELSSSIKEYYHILLRFVLGLSYSINNKYVQAKEIYENISEYMKNEIPNLENDIKSNLEKMSQLSFLFGNIASIIIVNNDNDDISRRWPELLRNLINNVDRIISIDQISDYGHLLKGLIAFLDTNTVINQKTIDNLTIAVNHLKVLKSISIIDKIHGNLVWRKNVLNDFWFYMNSGRYEESKKIFDQELKPWFSDKMPESLELAELLISWSLGLMNPQLIEKSINKLEHVSKGLSPNIFSKFKESIKYSEDIKFLSELCSQEKYKELIKFVQETKWPGMQKGNIPIVVAITILFAHYKLEHIEETKNLGNSIRQSKNLPEWMQNYGNLLVGYTHYTKSNFEEASTAFEAITVHKLLDHDVDKYWAISHFGKGKQLLENNKNEEAFDYFSKSLKNKFHSINSDLLSNLFIHFGLKHLKLGNGSRALQAFETVKSTVAPDKDNKLNNTYLKAAQIGEFLCKILNNKTIFDINSDELLKHLSKNEKFIFERTFRILVICHSLRLETLKDPRERNLSKIKNDINKQVKILQELNEVNNLNDATLLVLQGLLILNSDEENKHKNALEIFNKAQHLAINSHRLNQIINDLTTKNKELAGALKNIMMEFDRYFTSGNIPYKIKNETLIGIEKIYNQNRPYRATDFSPIKVYNDENNIINRLQTIVEILNSINQNEDKKINKETIEDIGNIQKELKKQLDKALETEKDALVLLSKQFQSTNAEIKQNKEI